VGQDLQGQEHPGRCSQAAQPGDVEDRCGLGVIPREEALHCVIEPPGWKQERFGDFRGGLVDGGLGLEYAVDIAGRAVAVVGECDRRPAYDVHLSLHASAVERLAERGEGRDDLLSIHVVTRAATRPRR
jgi:hypothetical protein